MVFWGRRARSCLHPAVGLGDLGAFHWGPRGFPAWSELQAEVSGVVGKVVLGWACGVLHPKGMLGGSPAPW